MHRFIVEYYDIETNQRRVDVVHRADDGRQVVEDINISQRRAAARLKVVYPVFGIFDTLPKCICCGQYIKDGE